MTIALTRYSTEELQGVISLAPRLTNTLTARYFPRELFFETEAISWDKVDRKRRVAPFVHPLMPAKFVDSAGFNTDSFVPAYVKDLRRFNPGAALKRTPGEPYGGGTVSPQERLDRQIVLDTADFELMLERRIELMVLEALRTGKITVSGEDYQTQVVDFLRHAALTPADLSGGDRWNQTTAKPLNDMRSFAALGQRYGYAWLRDVIMPPETFDTLMDNTKFEAEFDSRNTTNATIAPDGSDDEGLVYQGTARGFKFFTYSAWYIDSTGTEVGALADGDVIMTTPAIEGAQCFGAIQDVESLQAVRTFAKQYEQENPSALFLLQQSAPLPVPVRPNCSLKVKVY